MVEPYSMGLIMDTKTVTKTKVIFRKFKDNQVIALFPELPATNDPWTCESYMHIGQHSSADPRIILDTLPASEAEYKELKSELTRIGYDLIIQKRFHRNAYYVRKQVLKEMLKEPYLLEGCVFFSQE